MLASSRTRAPTAGLGVLIGHCSLRIALAKRSVVEPEGFGVFGEDVECSASPFEIGAQIVESVTTGDAPMATRPMGTTEMGSLRCRADE